MLIDLELYDNEELLDGISLAKKITEIGDGTAEAYLVGGCVRDIVRHQLGQTDDPNIHDVDIATSLSLDELKRHFKTASNNGEKHGTLLVFWNNRYFEVTHFRTDGVYSDGRHPDTIELTDSFEEDTARRDFTINALGMRWDGDIIDYHGGVNDIEQKIIRAVGDPMKRFEEDALRMVRGIRFCVNFDYFMSTETGYAICKSAPLLENVSNERIRSELLKLHDASDAFHFLERFVWYGLVDHTKWLEGMNVYEVKFLVASCESHLTSENLIPVLAYLGTEKNIDALVPTREEKKLWQWLRSYGNIYQWSPDKNFYWTSLVQLTSGDYKLLLDMFDDQSSDDEDWLDDLLTAEFMSMNPPDTKKITEAVQSMGIPQGKEFGDKVRELLETEYAKLAKTLGKQIVVEKGNSSLVYNLEQVNKRTKS